MMNGLQVAKIDQEVVESAIVQLTSNVFLEAGKRQEGQQTARDTYEFGYSYHRMIEDPHAPPTTIPLFLISLYQAVVKALQESAEKDLKLSATFNNCIISVFGAGDKLQPHIDHDEEKRFTSDGRSVGFYYGKDVVGVILEADETGSLYLQKYDNNPNEPYDPSKALPLNEENGTVYLMSAGVRYAPYMHGVSTVRQRRISVTFRTAYIR